jgi:hypothetical protein
MSDGAVLDLPAWVVAEDAALAEFEPVALDPSLDEEVAAVLAAPLDESLRGLLTVPPGAWTLVSGHYWMCWRCRVTVVGY